MGQFNGKAENIESNLNKVTSVNSARTDTEYPTAKAVFDFAKTDKTYDPESEQAQSGKAVAQAISHFDTVLKSGNTFIFDGGRPSGKIDIDLVVDSELDPQSQNPLENKRIAAELSDLDTKSNENAAGVYNLGERATTTEEKVEDLDTRLTTTEEKVEDLDTRLTTTEGQVDDLVERDYIVEQGISGIWTYRKWASGIAECWGCVSHTASGSAEYFQQIIVSLPSIFKERGRAFISTTGYGGYNIPKAYDNTFGTTEVALTYYQNTIREELCEFMVFVLGRWK